MEDVAAKLADKGWAPFPVRGKHPLVRWKQYQMGDLDEDGNDPWGRATGIGIDCGRSGLVVIDIDDPGGLARLEDEVGTLASYGTLSSRTHKGVHYIFAAHGDPVTNARGRLPAGIDVRGQGGYILVPPSIHPDGGKYEWDHRTQPAPFPDELRAIVSATTDRPDPAAPSTGEVEDPWARRALDDECGLIRGALQGGRNLQLYRSGLKLFSIVNGGRLTEGQVVSALQDAAFANSNGPRMESFEVERTLQSARRNATEVREPQSRHSNDQPALPAVDARQGFGVLDVDGLENLPEPKWLLKERVPEGQTWVYGAPGVGKTFVTLDWAASIAASGKTVMAFIGEGVSGYARRVAAWRQAHPEADLSRFLAVPQAPHLLDTRSVEQLAATVREREPDLIVVDTWARALVGGDENSAQDTGRAIDVLDRLYRTYGCSSLVVHHSQKHGQMERGSGAIRGAADATWEVATYQGPGEYDAMEVACRKMKDAEPPAPWLVQLRQYGDSAVVYPSALA